MKFHAFRSDVWQLSSRQRKRDEAREENRRLWVDLEKKREQQGGKCRTHLHRRLQQTERKHRKTCVRMFPHYWQNKTNTWAAETNTLRLTVFSDRNRLISVHGRRRARRRTLSHYNTGRFVPTEAWAESSMNWLCRLCKNLRRGRALLLCVCVSEWVMQLVVATNCFLSLKIYIEIAANNNNNQNNSNNNSIPRPSRGFSVWTLHLLHVSAVGSPLVLLSSGFRGLIRWKNE